MKAQRPVKAGLLAICAAALLSPAIAPAEAREADAFVDWASRNLTPLDMPTLGRVVGDARLVSFGESAHLAAEPLELRNELFRYLVEHKGFTAIAIESGTAESRIVHDYVLGGPGDLDTVTHLGFSWTFHTLPQNKALVSWMREYNATHARKISFYGFDVPGSVGNNEASRGGDSAIVDALRYLEEVDGASTDLFRRRFEPFVRSVRFDLDRPADAGDSYDLLTGPQRDALTANIADLVALFERNEGEYTAASSGKDYSWGYRMALGARQVDDGLRAIPLGWTPAHTDTRYLFAVANVRDRAQADNFDWVVDQEGPDGKILIFAHRVHLSEAPVLRTFKEGGEEAPHYVMGTHLRRRYGERLTTIAEISGKGAIGCGSYREALRPAPLTSVDGLAGQISRTAFVLDLRSVPESASPWLLRETALAHGRLPFVLPVGRAFDVLVSSVALTPACQ
jgi:erythromycin esterase